MKLFITIEAEPDLIEIWKYITKDNSSASTRILNGFEARTRTLLDNPELGPARPDIRNTFRHLLHNNYLILYQIIPEGIEVVRYIHGTSDLKPAYTYPYIQ